MATKQLSILFLKDGFSFCVLKDHAIMHAERVMYNNQLSTSSDKLNESFKRHLYLNQSYDEVNLCYLGNQFNLVPTPYFDQDNDAQKWLEFSSEIFEGDKIFTADLPDLNAKLIYAIPKELLQFIQEKFPEKEINSASSLFINHIMSESEDPELFLYIHPQQLEMQIYNQGQLQLYNIFEINTKEDLVYFVLNSIQQLGLDPNTIKLYYFGGEIDNSSLKMLMNFVRHVMPGTGDAIELEYFTEIQNTK